MTKPLLTIAIPTYNGAESIGQVLNALNEANINDKIIEIVVSDNCSNDTTAEVCKKFQPKSNVLFKYGRNEENLGFDKNVIKAISLATADYVWLCSDNEILADKDGINKIIDLVLKYEPAFIFLEHDAPVNIKNCFEFYEDSNQFFLDIKFKSGLISNCVIKKSVWENIDLSSYIDKLWIHFAYQIEALSPLNNKDKIKACVLKDRIFKSLPVQPKWGSSGSFIDTSLKLIDIFSNLSRLGYSSKVIRQAKMVIKGGYPENLRVAKKEWI